MINQNNNKNLPKSVIICTGCFSILVCGVFFFIIHKIKHLPFFNFGPSDTLKFFLISIDTWSKWSMVITYIILSTLCASLVTELVMPYIITQIQDLSKPIPAKPWQLQLLVQVYYLSWSVQTIITTYVYFSQLDIIIFQMIVYNIVSFFTTRHYIKKKQYVLYDII